MSSSSMGTSFASLTSMFISSFSNSSLATLDEWSAKSCLSSSSTSSSPQWLAYLALVVSPFSLALACRLETFVEKLKSAHSPEDYSS
ncbi:hypothetical protein QYF36_008556 [Acer negundo]|nr:hypothetical protein QYF36_008556 [Acer negundo]